MRNRDEACIALPPLVFEDSEKDVGLVFTYYNSPSLFPLADKNNSNSSTVVGTSVIGAIVGGGNHTGNVTIILPFLLSVRMCYVYYVLRICVFIQYYILRICVFIQPAAYNRSTIACVSWDFSGNGIQFWHIECSFLHNFSCRR